MTARAQRDDIALDLGGCLAPPLARAHGVTRDEVLGRSSALDATRAALLGPRPPSGFLVLPERAAQLRQVTRTARELRARQPDDVIHIGIGGSSLGAEVLFRALAHPQHNLLPARLRRAPRVHFVDNVDPQSLGALLEWVDLRRAVVHVVSKSGTTVETAAGFQIVREALARRRGIDWREHCVFTCGPGALRELATREGVRALDFPADVGGRFSALTASGLLTPAIAGVDVTGVMRGARRYLDRVRSRPAAETPSALAAVAAYLLDSERGKPIHVLMSYADALEPLARWYVQLAGESLGKLRAGAGGNESVGPTPLAARGTTDQHSQLQLFVEGPADKLVCFVSLGEMTRELEIAGGDPAPDLAGVPLGRLLRAELAGTEVALQRAGRPSWRWELPRLGPAPLGQLLLALELQTAYQAALYGVDAYDQPGVEAGKVAAFALIGRAGYENARAEVEANQPPSWKL